MVLREKQELKARGYLAIWNKQRRKYILETDPLAPRAKEILGELNTLDTDSVDALECTEHHPGEPTSDEIAASTDKYKDELKALGYFAVWDGTSAKISLFNARGSTYPVKSKRLCESSTRWIKIRSNGWNMRTKIPRSSIRMRLRLRSKSNTEELKMFGYRALWNESERKFWLQCVGLFSFAEEICQKLNALNQDSVDSVECPERPPGRSANGEIVALIAKYKAELNGLGLGPLLLGTKRSESTVFSLH